MHATTIGNDPLWLPFIAARSCAGPTTGLGTLALASLLDPSLLRGADAESEPASRHAGPSAGAAWSIPLHFAPKIKRIIYLYMAGGPSHLETLDFKPTLAKMNGQPMPESFTAACRSPSFKGQKLVCLAPQHPFQPLRAKRPGAQHDLPPPGHGRRRHLHHPLDGHRGDQPRPGSHVHEHGHHDLGPAGDGILDQLRSGERKRRSPGFVVLTSDGHFGQAQPIASRQWHSGFLPSRFQGVRFYSKGDPVLYMGQPAGTRSRAPARRRRRRPRARFDRG